MQHSAIENEPRSELIGSEEPGYIDYVKAWMKANGVSTRTLAKTLEGRVSRSRLHELLHGSRDKRSRVKLDEIYAIFHGLGIEHYQAVISVDIIRHWPRCDIEQYGSVAMLLAAALKGLPERLLEMLADLDGLSQNDVRRAHGQHIQDEICNIIEKEYRKVLRRKEERENRLFSFGD